MKDVGRLDRWILHFAPFIFMVKHTRGVDKVVADALSCMFHDSSNEDVDVASGA